MSLTRFDPVNYPRFPLTNVSPFTYRDGFTFLEVLEQLRRHINDTIVPGINANFDLIVQNYLDALTQMEAENDAAVADLQAIYDAFMADVSASLRAMNEPEVKALIDDDTSTVSASLNGKYARKDRLPVNVRDYGAIGDGVADDSAAIQAAINATPDHGIITGRQGDTYRFLTPLTLTAADSVTWRDMRLAFAGAQSSTSGAVSAITLSGCVNVCMERITLDVLTQTQQCDGIRISNSHGVTLREVRVSNARWNGIAIYDTAAGSSSDVTLDNCVAEFCRVGLLSNGERTVIRGGRYSSRWTETAEYVAKAGVWHSSSLYYDGIILSAASGWVIDGVTLDDNGQSGIYAGGGVHDGAITGCLIVGNANKGVDLGAVGIKSASNRLWNIAVSGNTVRDNATGDIHFGHVDDSAIVGNVARRSADEHQAVIILSGNCQGNVIAANAVSSASTTLGPVFVNSTAGSSENVIAFNSVSSPFANHFSVDVKLNTLVDAANGGMLLVSRLLDGPVVDLTGRTSVDGREILSCVGGTDTYYQITVDKELHIQNIGGVTQPVRAGLVTADSGLNVGSGLTYLSDGVTLRLPRTASTTAGALWYDATTGRLIWRDSIANLNRDIAYVETSGPTNLGSATSTINTSGKYAGKQVFNTVTNRPVWATGATAASTWVHADGTVAYSPA